jgi:rubredoxin
LLIELSKLYYRQLNPEKEKPFLKDDEKTLMHPGSSYQCSNCLTVYDKKYGDPLANIPPGILFEDLPVTYVCNVCNSPKKFFVEMLVSEN